MNRIRSFALAVLVTAACAREDLGISPLSSVPEQLYAPFGIARVPALGAAPQETDLLIVSSTNMDQRFNAGTVNAYRLSTLAAGTPELQTSCAEHPILYDEELLPRAHLTTVRVRSSGGDLVPFELDGRTYLGLPSRFGQSVSLLEVDPSRAEAGQSITAFEPTTDDLLGCRRPDEPRLGATDCSIRYTLVASFDDPMTLISVPGLGLLTAHLFDPDQDQRFLTGSPLVGYVTVISEDILRDRLGGQTVEPLGLPLGYVLGLNGARGLAVGSGPDQEGQVYVSSDRNVAEALLVVRVSSQALADLPPPPEGQLGSALEPDEPRLIEPDPVDLVDLGPVTQGFATRGLVFAPAEAGLPPRLYATVRIFEVEDSDNSALAVLAPTDDGMELLDLIELGTELGRPVLSPFTPDGQRLLYVPDTRSDQIYVVDVTTDQPIVRHRIDGRAVRVIDGDRLVLARTLATPVQMVFDERDGRRLAFVTNFENSTLAVLDLTDPNPIRHCLVARIGRDLRTDDTREEEGEEEEDL